MRTFILRARKCPVTPEKIMNHAGKRAHVEIIAHTLMNAFFTANHLREAVEVYLVLESSADFPRIVQLTSADALSFPGFDEASMLSVVVDALDKSQHIQKGETLKVASGISVLGYGFETLVRQLQLTRPLYLLDKKGEDVRLHTFAKDPVIVLSDHLKMPKNIVKSLSHKGLTQISLGKKMLFASQCVVLVQDEMDRQNI